MSDAIRTEFTLRRRPAIDVSQPRRFGEMSLTANVDGTILHLLGRPGVTTEHDISTILQNHGHVSLRNAGAGQWFAVWDYVLAGAEIDAVDQSLAGKASVVDQTHGRVRIGLRGSPVRRVLSKGTGVDLHKDSFPIGTAVMTLIGHIGVNLARVDDDTFELLALRGFAQCLWHDLETMSGEFV